MLSKEIGVWVCVRVIILRYGVQAFPSTCTPGLYVLQPDNHVCTTRRTAVRNYNNIIQRELGTRRPTIIIFYSKRTVENVHGTEMREGRLDYYHARKSLPIVNTNENKKINKKIKQNQVCRLRLFLTVYNIMYINIESLL